MIGTPHGDIACFSLHPRKIITTGEGGVITTNNARFDRQVKLLRHQGMTISDYMRHHAAAGAAEHYSITGYNYRMSDIQAAIGIEQLNKMPGFIRARRQINAWYRHYLRGISWLQLPHEPAYAKTNWQSYPIRLLQHAPVKPRELIRFFAARGIATKPGIMNAHQEMPYNKTPCALPHSEHARQEVLLFPCYVGLKESDIRAMRKLLII
jgi:dTDP-4-amino-4,6-dideoxygalactose transaminase